MKMLAEGFIGKECLIYTVGSDSPVDGTLREISDSGLLVAGKNGELQAVNLEYVVKIREWPRNSKGKKKSVFV